MPRFSPSLIVLASVSTALGLPLLTATGRMLEYEYVSMAAFVSLLLAPALALAWPSSVALQPRHASGFVLAHVLGLMVLYAAFPLGLCLCAPQGYVLWAALQFLPTLLWATLLFCAAVKLRENGWGRGAVSLLLVLFLILAAAELMATLWMAPQKRATHVLFGFLAGPIYDRRLHLDSAIAWVRCAHASLALAGLLALFVQRRRPVLARLAAFGFLVLWAVLRSAVAGEASVAVGETALREALPLAHEGEDFHIYGQMSARARARLVQEIDFHLTDLAAVLGRPDSPIQVYVYPDRRSKKLWFGGTRTDITDVRNLGIHLSYEGGPARTLRHELVHVLSAPTAYHGLGFHPNMALTEGLAVALAPEERALTLDQSAGYLLAHGNVPPLTELFGAGFFSLSGSRSYALSGSFIRHLLRTKGARPLMRHYAGASFEEAFAMPLSRAVQDWEAHVRAAYRPGDHAAIAATVFRRRGVFASVCPHTEALLREAHEDALSRFAAKGLPDLPDWLARKREHGVALASHPELQMRSRADTRLSLRPEVAERLDSSAAIDEQAALQLLLEDLDRWQGRASVRAPLPASAPRYLLRSWRVRAALDVHTPSSSQRAWLAYLAGWRGLPEEGDSFIYADYLRLRRQSGLSELKNEHAGWRSQLGEDFFYEWQRIRAVRLWRLDEPHAAASAWHAALSAAPPGARELLQLSRRMALGHDGHGPDKE